MYSCSLGSLRSSFFFNPFPPPSPPSSSSSIAVAEMRCMCPVGPENWFIGGRRRQSGAQQCDVGSHWCTKSVFSRGMVRVQCFRYRRIFLCHSRRTRVGDSGCRIVEQCATGGGDKAKAAQEESAGEIVSLKYVALKRSAGMPGRASVVTS